MDESITMLRILIPGINDIKLAEFFFSDFSLNPLKVSTIFT